jgi:ABC-type molybdate transport system substrate-binding protein
MLVAPGLTAQPSAWQETWDETLAAAKKEGKVVVVGSPDPVMRNQITPLFQARHGIVVEFIAGSSTSLWGACAPSVSPGSTRPMSTWPELPQR